MHKNNEENKERNDFYFDSISLSNSLKHFMYVCGTTLALAFINVIFSLLADVVGRYFCCCCVDNLRPINLSKGG